MSRFYLHLTLLPIALFTIVLILIHTQPYDDHKLRELLLPEGCPAPCFMGIRPGVTTFDEAMQILKASNWTSDIKLIRGIAGKINRIEWNWSDSASSMLNSKIANELLPPYVVNTENPLVEQMSVETTIPIGDIYLLLGESYMTQVWPEGTKENVAIVLALYRKNNFFISSFVYCPVTRQKFLNSPASITWMPPMLIDGYAGFHNINFFC